MSCITTVGRHVYFGPECNVVLPRTLPEWTRSKMDRMTSFALDPSASRRAVAAGHPKTRPGLLLGLMMDENVRVRRAAIKNPAVTPAMIRIGLRDPDPGIVAYATVLRDSNLVG